MGKSQNFKVYHFAFEHIPKAYIYPVLSGSTIAFVRQITPRLYRVVIPDSYYNHDGEYMGGSEQEAIKQALQKHYDFVAFYGFKQVKI